MYENDEFGWANDIVVEQEARWRYMRNWVQQRIIQERPKVAWLPSGVMEFVGSFEDLYPDTYEDCYGFDTWMDV